MGHVDPHIQHLVDVINQHHQFVTLSSCSGRIALFHPTATTTVTETKTTTTRTSESPLNMEEGWNVNPNHTENGTTTGSGKGSTGSWVFVSHDVVDDPTASIVPFFFPPMDKNIDKGIEHTEPPYELEKQQQPQQEHVCYFRFEPMLLHVAACHLEAGQFLLQVALQNGLRESGLIVTPQRVTVAFRTHSLAMSIPLSFQKGHIFFPKCIEYIVSLTNELNRRLLLNLQLIDKVLASVQRAFRSMDRPSMSLLSHQAATEREPRMEQKVIVSWEQKAHNAIPDLNLYGHAAIALVSTVPLAECGTGVDVREILIFGGYGIGPTTSMPSSPVTSPSKMRSERIYRLQQQHDLTERGKSSDFQWRPQWDTVNLSNMITTDENTNDITHIQIVYHKTDCDYDVIYSGNIQVGRMAWDGRLFTAAVNLTTIMNFVNNCKSVPSTTLMLLFGGRYGPNKPMNDLTLFEYVNSSATTFTPQDVRGTTPTPRWGHTLTALEVSRRESPPKYDPTAIIPVAVLIGGRHTHGNCADPLYVLSLVPPDASHGCALEYHFLWEQLATAGDSLGDSLSRCFHTATMIDDTNHVFIFGGLHSPENLLEGFDVGSANDDEEPTIALLLTLPVDRFRVNTTISDINKSFSVQIENVKLPTVSHRFAHSAINLASRHERDHENLDGRTGIIVLAGGTDPISNSNTSIADNEGTNSTFMDCLHYTLTNGKIVLDGIRVDITYNDVDGNHEAIDPGPMINHCSVSFPEDTTDEKPGTSHYNVLFIGGGVAGFAFQELFAPSHHLSFQWNDIDGRVRVENDSEPNGCISPSANLPKLMKPPQLDEICGQQLLCDVVYVWKQNAKIVKVNLEDSGFINKLYRMTAIEATGIIRWSQSEQALIDANDIIKDYIAIPIRAECIGLVHDALDSNVSETMSLIVGYGRQICPPSTGTYARGIGIPEM